MKKIYSYAAIASLMMLCFTEAGWGQTSIGPNYPGTGVNVGGTGTVSWANTNFITEDDENFATVWLANSSYTSEYLKGSNYGFAIPSGAVINGIQVKIMRKSSYVGDYRPDDPIIYSIYDVDLNLVKAGAINGEDRAATSEWWPAEMTEATYGGETDLWGTTWSAEEINSSNFGVSLSVTQNGSGQRTASVDYMTVTVYYTYTTTSTTGDYRSAQSGSWNTLSTWERYNGTTWVTPTAQQGKPDNSSGLITIRNGHVITVTPPVNQVDQVVVESGGQVRMDSNADLNIADNPLEVGNDFVVYGTLYRSNGTIRTDGALVFGNGGIYEHAQNGGSIPVATWNVNSTCNITGAASTAPDGFNQTFGNVTWNCAQTADIALNPTNMSITGNLTVAQTGTYSIGIEQDIIVGKNLIITGGQYRICSNSNRTQTIMGKVSVTGGTLALNTNSSTAYTGILNVAGNFSHTAGILSNTGTGTGSIVFNGTYDGSAGIQIYTSGGTVSGKVDFRVNSGAYLQMNEPGTILTGDGIFTLSGGASLGITSPSGITTSGGTGNIQVTGTRLYSQQANYIFNGSNSQVTGNGLPATVNNLTFHNPDQVITFSAACTITNNFSMTSGTVARLAAFTHNTRSLTLRGIGQPSGTYGGEDSGAGFVLPDYFVAGPGIINNNTPAGTWLGRTNTDWNTGSNWSNGAVPGTGTGITIFSSTLNQPVISGLTNAVGDVLRINSGASLTIDPTGSATFNLLTNNGRLNLESNATDIASLILGEYNSNSTGTNNIQIHLTGGGTESNNDWPWHYISSPVSGLPVRTFTETTWDIAQFIESLPTSEAPFSFQRGWIAFDGWSYYFYPGNVYNSTYSFGTLALGKGYNYWADTETTIVISGAINTTNPVQALTYTGSDPILSGYNLLGNPYTSGFNIQYLFDNDLWPSNALRSVWFTKNNSSYVYNDGVGVPAGTDGHIPPMQGFFVKTTGSGTFNFYIGAREHNSTPRYKGDKSSIPLVRLSIKENGKTEETVVRFDTLAKPDIDVNFDAPRMFASSTNNPSIYSLVDGVEYTINGIPFPEISKEIPIVVNLLKDGNHIVSAMELEGLDSYQVTLTDKSTNSTVDLKTVKEYAFTASAGLIKDRFVLTVTNISTGTEDPLSTENLFNIYNGFGLINIQPLSDEWDGKTGTIKVMDFSGKTIINQQKAEFRKNTLIQLQAPGPKGLYFVEIRSGMMKYIGKIVIR